jgi:nucleoside-diphosphate-sugar epimerase/SAM-dependent methyltransferase/quercetin dioxygenase-like cupin family protein
MKIVITGGIGYIGTELCKLYAKESHENEIVVLDNRFLSERVKQLNDWGIHFIHGDILDETLVKTTLENADIVYHLAGITNVAYVKTESNSEKDKQITKVGIEGSLNVFKQAPQKCKVVFPSTHVIYEGFKETRFNITEEETPTPVLTYAKGKCATEKDIRFLKANHVILRLGSNYGYSNDSTRINIMPNLFSKITSQNGTIKLFSGGKQHKSVVSVFDVARCAKFLGESDHIGTFNCTDQNLTVKEVAEICKEINPKLTVVETDDEVPNLGYTMDNTKLLNTGFKFVFNLKQCVKEMVNNWSMTRPDNTELEYKIYGGNEYKDDRGIISNFELYEPINLIGSITSKAGTVRANHFHPLQTQQVLLVSGEYISVIKDLKDVNAIISTKLVHEGEIVVTKPNVAHTMVFTKDSLILNLVNGERDHENFGVHTIPHILVNEKLRTNLVESAKSDCRVCGSTDLKRFLDLGLSPLANNLLNEKEEETDLYPLELNVCGKCNNVQLSCAVPSKKMFDNYLYVSSTSSTFVKHFDDAAEKYIKEFNLTKDSLVIDIGSNDGIALQKFFFEDIQVLGFEPSNIAELAREKGIPTIQSYFNATAVDNIIYDNLTLGNQVHVTNTDLILASNVFAHSDDLFGMCTQAMRLLKPSGKFIIEVQYLLDTMRDLTFDNIYHEHFNYWTVSTLQEFLKGISNSIPKILDVEHIDTHGGSIRVYIGTEGTPTSNVQTFIDNEKKFGLDQFKTYEDFGKKVNAEKERVYKKIQQMKSEGNSIVGYGSPAKATTLLNYFGISNEIDYIIEDNKLKHNKFVPGMKIPIYGKDRINGIVPDKVIVFAWNFFDEIKKSNADLIERGSEFISIKDL